MVSLQIPFLMTVAGSTSSGKTYFVRKLIKHRQQLFSKPIEKIYYHYAIWQPIFAEMEKEDGITFVEGVPDMDELEPNSLLILDDLFSKLAKNRDMEELFCVWSHHKNISVIFITQQFFSNSPVMRCVTRNSHYIVLFKSPRMASVVDHLSRQVWPQRPQFLPDAYVKATKDKKYSYLFLNFHPTASDKVAVLTNIIPQENDYPHVFI